MTNILEILVCPITKGRLDYDAKRQFLISHQAKLAFPIEDNIPLMKIDTAIALESFEDDAQFPSITNDS